MVNPPCSYIPFAVPFAVLASRVSNYIRLLVNKVSPSLVADLKSHDATLEKLEDEEEKDDQAMQGLCKEAKECERVCKKVKEMVEENVKGKSCSAVVVFGSISLFCQFAFRSQTLFYLSFARVSPFPHPRDRPLER